jgi:hypothetical protein
MTTSKHSLALVAFSALGMALTGCQTSDYAGSVSNFSSAVSAAAKADNSIAQAAVTARTEQLKAFATQNANAQVEFSAVKCGAAAGYKPGDCAVTIGGLTVLTGLDAATGSLTKYSAALSAIINDKSADTLATNAGALGSAVQGLAKAVGASGVAPNAGAAATIVGQLGALAIKGRQLQILREATATADPLVTQLADLIGDRDANLTSIAIQQQVTDLEALRASFNHDPKRDASDLTTIAQLAASIDKAQQEDPRNALKSLAKIHHTLTENLAKPTVSWGAIQSDAQALVQNLQAISSAAETLASTSTATVAAQSAKK